MANEQQPLLFVRQASGLTRAISSWTVIFFGLGVQYLPFHYYLMGNIPFFFPGVDLVLIYFLGSLFVLIEVASMALIYVAMPRSGAIYVPMSRSISPALGMMEAWRSIIQNPTQRGVTAFIGAGQLASVIIITGRLSHQPGLLALGSAFQGNVYLILLVALLVQVVGLIITTLGPRMMGRWVFVWGIGAVFGILLVAGLFLSTPASALQGKWDATFGQGAYNEVVNLANQNGFKHIPISSGPTISAALIPVSITFPYTIMPLVGEVEKPRKNIPLSMMGSGVVILITNTVVSWAYVNSYGDFARMYWATSTNPAVASKFHINTAFNTDTSSFAAVLAGSPTVTGLAAFSPQWSNFNDLILNNAYCSRPLFALAMDRMGPSIFAKVDNRFHTPYVGNITWFILSLPTMLLATVASSAINDIIGGTIFAFALARSMQHWSEVALPFTRPEIAKQGLNIKVGGVDLMSILGAFTTAVFLYLIGSNQPQTLASGLYVAGMYAVGLLVFVVYSAKNQARGISVTQIYSQLPPE